MVLSFESVDEITRCDHSSETSLAVLLHGAIYNLKIGTCLEFSFWALLSVKGLSLQLELATNRNGM